MSRMRSERRKTWSAPIIILLLMVIGGGLIFVHTMEQRELERDLSSAAGSGYDPLADQIIELDGESFAVRKDLDTYLLIGLDKVTETLSDPESYVNNQQCDFLVLMIVDHSSRSYTAIHINRDTMTEIQRYGLAGKKLQSTTGQIALAHTYGGGGRDSARYTAEAVSKLLYGVPMEHYSALMLDAIPALNDLVGGVSVYVEDDFGAARPELKQGTTVRLQGSQALTFIQARGSMQDKSNLNRMNRQRVYMQALYEQMTGQLNGDENFALRLATELSDYMISDLSVSELAELANMWKSYAFQGIETVAGEAVLGDVYIEFYHDADALLQQVLRLMFEPAY